MTQETENTYCPGHPWYYFLGGKVLTPKQILQSVIQTKYSGYDRDNIAKADQKPEPQRSELLRKLRLKFLNDLKRDLSIYRAVVRKLHAHRKLPSIEQGSVPRCDDVDVAMSLKHNHLFNDFAHLYKIDMLLAQQPDLFDF